MAVMQVDDVLSEARYFISRLIVLVNFPDIPLPLDEAIFLSVVVLGETLEFSKANIFKDVTGGQMAPMNLWDNRYLLSHFLREQGCCPDHVHMLESTASAGTMYYAYRSGHLHDGKDHGECTTKQCVAHQINLQMYQTAHLTPECSCEHVQAPMEKANRILSNGGIPIISFNAPLTSYENLDIDAVDASDEVQYIAISHVWSDGLGNPKSNSLPRCQIQYLRDRTLNCLWTQGRKDAKRVQLWIDTLCVPLDEPLRGRAIELIKDTFGRASEILVLDGRLKSLSREVPYTENMMRVTCSIWLRRVWTFLEGVLAKKLVFQFADGQVEIRYWIYDRFRDKSIDL